MSKFRVDLSNIKQGTLDSSAVDGAHSLQRQVYVPGPNGEVRILKDGEEFEGCNYWKRFAFPYVPLEEAMLVVLEDDNSLYDGVENKYKVSVSGSNSSLPPSNYVQLADFVSDYNGMAHSFYIQNTDSTAYIDVKLNGDNNMVVRVYGGQSLSFESGDVLIKKVEAQAKPGSGGASCKWFGSVKVFC